MKRLGFIFSLLSYFLFAFSQNYSYDLVYQKLELWVNPARYYIIGAVTLRINVQKMSSYVSIDLTSSLTVDSIVCAGSKLDFSHLNDRIDVSFGRDTIGYVTFTVFYQGEPASSGFSSFNVSTHDNKPVMWTLSEPYGAKDWFPTKNNLGDKIDSLDVIIHTQPEYNAASNGILVLDTVIDNDHIMHWKSRYPITSYLVAFAVTNYVVYTDTAYLGDSLKIPIVNYVYPEDYQRAKEATPYAARCIEFFSSKFIPYPFYKEKYGHAQFGWGGGMEHQTMTFVGGFSQSLLSHELAHQWFGDYVTCGSWAEIYLNEGFATYLEGLTAEAGLASYNFDSWLNSARNGAFNASGSIYVDDTTNVSRIFDYGLSYLKSALFLHLLRWTVGDSAFFNALRSYLLDPQVANDYAHTQDLKRHLEKACNCDLTEIFNDWLYGDGYPYYAIEVLNTDSHNFTIRIDQHPISSTVDFFELKIPILFIGRDKDSLIVINNTENGQTLSFDFDFDVMNIVFDPDQWLLAKARIDFDIKTDWIYPTITSDYFNFAFYMGAGNQYCQIKVFDLKGQLLKFETFSLGFMNYAMGRVDVSDFKPGIYIVKVMLLDDNLDSTDLPRVFKIIKI